MLKITTRTEATGTIFELEGKLAGPWVDEFEACWQRGAIADRPVRVRLKTVTFIDSAGRELLAEMYRQGVELVAEGCEGCMTKAIVQEIMRGGRA